MFSYLRYFFGASIIIILGGALVLGWRYRVAADEIITAQAQANNLAIAKSFKNTLWDPQHEIIKLFYAMKPEEMDRYTEFRDFSKKSRDLLQDIPIVKFNLYTPQGEKWFSTNQAVNLPDNPEYNISGADGNLTPMTVITTGKPQSEIIYNAEFRRIKGNRDHGVLVRTLVPLVSNQYISVVSGQQRQVEGVLEIYFEVTEAAGTLRAFQYISTVFIIAIFAILYISLVYTSRRAEKIIERQHETNVELAAAKATAESENQQKSQFLANISHELRTPLNAIIGFSEIIKDEVMGEIGNDQYKSYIKDIHSSGVHLLSLINDILDYSKAEAGKLEMEYEDIDLTKLITSSLRLQEPRAKSAEVNLAKDLPEEHLIIRSDAKRIKQVLLNLLSNAVKFTPAGGSVTISAWRDLQSGGDSVCIEVKDTGIGIAPKDIAKALSPFGQVDSELSRRYEGTGLGLPLTKKFVELLGGVLRLESELNKGTTLTVTLPTNNDPNSVAQGSMVRRG